MKLSGNKRAFTLVELLIVIAILAILGVITFITLSKNIESSSNSSKITALNNIKTTVVSYKVSNGIYPDPTDNVSVNYSGAIVWKQGTFGKDVIKKVKGSKEVFLDPTTDNEYSYSITDDRKEFQIGGVLTSETSYNNLFISSTSAASKKVGKAILLGDYNGSIMNVKVGGITNILTIPSIMASDLSSTNLVDILNNNRLVLDKSTNLPASYKNSVFNVNGGESLGSNNLVIFSGSLSSLKNERNRLKLLLKMKRSYNGTAIKNTKSNYLKDINVDLVYPSSKSLSLACDIVNNQINYKVKCNNDSFLAIPLKNFTNADFKGLISTKVITAFVDNVGVDWFGTDKGLSVYSSGSWIQFDNTNGLASNYIKKIVQVSNNNIWVGTDKGLSIYSSGSWTKFDNTNGLVGNYIKDIIQVSNNDIWVLTDNGVNKYSSGSFTSYSNELVSKDITGLVEASNNDIWVATDEGVNVFNGTTWSSYESELSSTNIFKIIRTSNNDIWVATDEGVNVFNGTTWLSYEEELIEKDVNYIFQSTDNKIWLATDGGISVFDGTSWNEYSVTDGLNSNIIISIFQENNQDMWFITKKGLSKLSGGVFTNYLSNSNTDEVHLIHGDSGLLILGEENN